MMGQGKKGPSDEHETVEIAWSRATHDPIKGRNQTCDTFDESVIPCTLETSKRSRGRHLQ